MRSRRGALLAALLSIGCSERALIPLDHASAERGREVLDHFDCGACHRIPGVRGPQGRVGPSLEHFSQRPYLAGRFENSPALLVRWIQDPPAMKPATAMPDLGLTEAQARDVAAYLWSLE
jgi:cytochrome c2